MKISLKKVLVRDLFNGYDNKFEDGVVGFGGKLNIRPKFQREFIYRNDQRDAVIDTVMNGFPINSMYWLRDEESDEAEPTYELMDGQQRTISICEYVEGNFAVNNVYFFKLPQEKQDAILNYPLLVYVVERGTHEEELAWFKKINTAGEKLTNQEIRNAIYAGPWVSDAKTYFSKTFCPAIKLGDEYLNGLPLRQDYLETVLRWISNDKIEEYMQSHYQDESAEPLWDYFNEVINWVKKVFPDYNSDMKGVEWGLLYNQFKDVDTSEYQKLVDQLYEDDAITNKRGIYTYIFTKDEHDLRLASFPPSVIKEAWKKQNKKCAVCGEADITLNNAKPVWRVAWKDGGKLTADNCRLVCSSCEYNYFRRDVEVYVEKNPDGRVQITRKNDRDILFTEGPKGLDKILIKEPIQ